MNDLLAALAVVFLGHMLPKLGRYRDFTWFDRSLQSLAGNQAYAQSNLLILLTVGGPMLAVYLLQQWTCAWFGGFGYFIFAFALLFYAWGPRDLDVDVEQMLDSDDVTHPELARSLFGSAAQPHDKSCWLAVTVFDAALERWFSVLFWFLLLGPVGALMYRLTDLGAKRALMKPEESAHPTAFMKLKYLLDWPAAQLLSLSLAIVSEFDTAYEAWRGWHHAYNSWFVLDTGFLDDVVCAVMFGSVCRHADHEVTPEKRYATTLTTAMALAWRCLIVWLIFIAVLVVARWFGLG